MKKTFFAICLTISVGIFGQNIPKFATLATFEGWEANLSSQEKLKVINNLKMSLVADCEFSFLSLEDFHVIDIDSDGLNDIVYSGSCGGSMSGVTSIYRFNGKTFEPMIRLFGRIFKTPKYIPQSYFSFELNNYACCGGFNNILEKYVMVVNNGILSFKLQEKSMYEDDTIFPPRFLDKPVSFIINANKTPLRLSPIVDDTCQLARPFERQGNAINGYHKGTIGIGLTEQNSIDGKTWWFVKIADKDSLGNWRQYEIGNSNEPVYFLGWIQKEYLKIN